MSPIQVLIVDDHLVARCGLRLMLSGAGDIEVCAEASSAAAALQVLSAQRVDVMLLDLVLPDKNGLDLLKLVRERYPRCAVLIISMQPEDTYGIRALKLGASGFLSKDSSIDTLVGAVHKAAGGGRYVSAALLQKLAGMIGEDSREQGHERLTDRELEIFKLIAAGRSLVNIAAQLHLSPSTVTTYRARILEKMALQTNAEITRYAVDHQLLF